MITYCVKPNSECQTRPRRDFWIWDQARLRPRRDWSVKLFRDRDYWLIFKENETETETEHGSQFHTRLKRDRESRILQSRDRDETETLVNQCVTWKSKVTWYRTSQVELSSVTTEQIPDKKTTQQPQQKHSLKKLGGLTPPAQFVQLQVLHVFVISAWNPF